jgi:hypothetical protein
MYTVPYFTYIVKLSLLSLRIAKNWLLNIHQYNLLIIKIIFYMNMN